jgi:hypothetical protein
VLKRVPKRHQVAVEWKEQFVSYIIRTCVEYICAHLNGVVGTAERFDVHGGISCAHKTLGGKPQWTRPLVRLCTNRIIFKLNYKATDCDYVK